MDDEALREALENGTIAMAGLDTLDHEPVQKDHPVLSWPEETMAKLLFSPHISLFHHSRWITDCYWTTPAAVARLVPPGSLILVYNEHVRLLLFIMMMRLLCFSPSHHGFMILEKCV